MLVVLSVSEQNEEGRNLPGRSNFQTAIVFTISVVEAYMMFISLHFDYFSVPPLLNVPRNTLHPKNKAKTRFSVNGQPLDICLHQPH